MFFFGLEEELGLGELSMSSRPSKDLALRIKAVPVAVLDLSMISYFFVFIIETDNFIYLILTPFI